jgi:co-chaperonin GroES (HSP10)
MKPADPRKTKPLGTWLLCASLLPSNKTASGLIMPKDFDKDVVSEGVAEVIAVGQGVWNDDLQDYVPLAFACGDKVLHRGFLRYGLQVGLMFGGRKDSSFFMIKAEDILAKVDGKGTIGYYDEYQF